MKKDTNHSTWGFFIQLGLAFAFIIAFVAIPAAFEQHNKRVEKAKAKKEERLYKQSVPIPATTSAVPKF